MDNNISNSAAYQSFLLKVLGDKVNAKLQAAGKKTIDTSDMMAVMTNLDDLYNEGDVMEFGSPTGEKYKYLSKEDKMILLRIISLTASIRSSCEWIDMTDDDKKPPVKALRTYAEMYFDRNDSRPVVTYQKVWTAKRLMDNEFANTTLDERANAEALARGICETRCLSKFGFGAWFGQDTDPETELIEKDNANSSVATVATPTVIESPSLTDIPDTTQDEVPFETWINTPVTEPEPSKVKEEKKKETVKKAKEPEPIVPSETINLTLDEARAVKATVGIAASKGFTLGVIADDEKMKRTNLCYIYIHSHNAKEKAAIRVIAENDEVVKASFEDKGVSLS